MHITNIVTYRRHFHVKCYFIITRFDYITWNVLAICAFSPQCGKCLSRKKIVCLLGYVNYDKVHMCGLQNRTREELHERMNNFTGGGYEPNNFSSYI